MVKVSQPKIILVLLFIFQACLVALALIGLTEALPFNAVGTPFYDGNVVRTPSFNIEEANPHWKGLVTKTFTLGGGH